jgi:putative hemolysin
MYRNTFAKWVLLSVVSATLSCQKEQAEPEAQPEPLVDVAYAQTYCADKWQQARTPADLVNVATAYLKQQGINLEKVQAAQENPPQLCNACQCKSGVVLRAQVQPKDVAALEALGFTK